MSSGFSQSHNTILKIHNFQKFTIFTNSKFSSSRFYKFENLFYRYQDCRNYSLISSTTLPTQNLKTVISIFSSQETGSSLVSLTMIFGALQSLFKFKIHSMGLKSYNSRNPTSNIRKWFRSGHCWTV